MMNGMYLNQSNKVKPLRGLDFRDIRFSIDMDALMGKLKELISIENGRNKYVFAR